MIASGCQGHCDTEGQHLAYRTSNGYLYCEDESKVCKVEFCTSDDLYNSARTFTMPPHATVVNGFVRVVEQTQNTLFCHSYRDTSPQMIVVRQTDGKQKVTWETASMPMDWPHEVITFAWTGGIGYNSEPGGGHFTVSLNHEKLIDFPFVQVSTCWHTDGNRVRLHYVVAATQEKDSLGIFYLTIAPEGLTPGEPAKITVTATAQSSQRWFGVHPYTDTVEVEKQIYIDEARHYA